MPLPRQLIYNDLSGEEVRHILEERIGKLLADVPYLQKHLTLPRVKMTLSIHLDIYADQPTPERHTISDDVDVLMQNVLMPSLEECDSSVELVFSGTVEDTVNAAPGLGGKPPDQIRYEHGLGVSVPTRGSLNHTALEDRVEGRRMNLSNGAVIDRTGQAPERGGSTVVVQDWGRADEGRRPGMPQRGGRDGGRVAAPVFRKDEQ